MYEKLGLVEESDLERYRKKLGIKKGVDLADLDVEDVDAMLEGTTGSIAGALQQANPKKKLTYMQRAKKDFDKEEFKKIVGDLQIEKAKLQEMDDDERQTYKDEKMKLKEVFRDEDIKHFPLIIKASTAGTLETLL